MACREISDALLAMDHPTASQVRSTIRETCSRHSMSSLPRNYEILATVHGADFDRLRDVLVTKPVKTASGVAVIALMPKPFACPHGRCTYCPGGTHINTPNSYTGTEPATINAIANEYDPVLQITSKLERLVACGHDPSKLELVIVGGTFLFMPESYRRRFIKSCYDALNGFVSPSLGEAQLANETARIRNVGLTIETKPDYCKREHVDAMLEYGATRVEIGVQSLQERVYHITNRGHTYSDVIESFAVARDSGYKIVAHMMPGLPTVTPREDLADFERLFADDDLKPDMLKIYPSLVLEGTPLYREYEAGRYTPYTEKEIVRLLVSVKRIVPPWVRIMRVQREITSQSIAGGPRQGNLRQIVLDAMRSDGVSCRCIRCREVGLAGHSADAAPPKLKTRRYGAAAGDEVFLSYEDADDLIYGFLRLRSPGSCVHRAEITPHSCIIRELHVYGRSLGVGQRNHSDIQHSGLGRQLLARAEQVAREDYDARKMLVISAVGTRQYYHRLGYRRDGPYMSRDLRE